MKINIFPSDSRGKADHGWLHSRFSFSFAEYFDRQRLNFGVLRVINDDIIEPGMGFGTHPHDNMEIITIVHSGSLEHKDSMGNGSVIKAGDIQIMSAGTGIRHSEFNPSKTDEVSLFQIWIYPKIKNIRPRYDQATIDDCQLYNNFHMVVAPMGHQEALQINQDAYIFMGKFGADSNVNYTLQKPGNGVFVMVVSGNAETEGYMLSHRDAAEISDTSDVSFKFNSDSEVLLIEVPL